MTDAIAFLTDYLNAGLRLSVPLAYAALGGLLSERSGVLNIGLEGMLLTGAFMGAVGALATGNVWFGVLLAAVGGSLVGLLHAYLCVSLRVNQLVSGLAINLLAAGFTAYGARLLFESGTVKLPSLNAINIPIVENIPLIGVLFQQGLMFYGLIALIIALTFMIFKTYWGLSLRAVGESPHAANAAGLSIAKVRYASVTASGCLSGLGGAYLALVHVGFFTENISAGKGFIALAALIFGRWHPIYASLAALLFGLTEALQLRVQALSFGIPYQFLAMLPYLVALFALIGFAGRSKPPAALGLPYPQEK